MLDTKIQEALQDVSFQNRRKGYTRYPFTYG